ncbi:Lipase_GDSL domain-containing protein [Psidium guajava]|nr:Lipase_GDSL domain-containing protein [Psidium guajava]
MAALPTSSSFFNLSLPLLLLLLLLATTTSDCRAEPDRLASLFAFGDSFLDAGNNNYINTTTLDRADFWPYGETYFKLPTGRFSDGRLISDFIAEYAELPLIPPYLQPGVLHQWRHGVNFASAGAGALVETFQGSVIGLQTQLGYFKEADTQLRQQLGKARAEWTMSRGVYMFSIGSNDYMSPFLTNSTILSAYSKSKYVEMVIGNLTAVIKEIYGMGGRKFGFINLPPLGCLPGMRIIKAEKRGRCLEEASSLAKLHNHALSKLLVKLEHQLTGFKYSLYDFNSNFRQRTNHPLRYGFKAGKGACCGTGRYRGVFSCGGKRIVKEFELCENPSEHVFWDSFHLTERAYEQLAHQMWTGEGIHSSSSPRSLKSLFEDL